MLGVTLLFVGAVLINNGACGLMKVQGKPAAVVNVLVGVLLTITNIISIIQGDYFAAGTTLLFAFTYLFAAANNIWGLDLRPFGIYSLFVAITTIPCAILAGADDLRMGALWVAWGVLWFTGFIEGTLGKSLGKFVPVLAVLEGIFTGWIPGFLIMINKW